MNPGYIFSQIRKKLSVFCSEKEVRLVQATISKTISRKRFCKYFKMPFTRERNRTCLHTRD